MGAVRPAALLQELSPERLSQARFQALRTGESCLMRRMAIHTSSKVCHLGQTCTLYWCFIQEPVVNFKARTQSQRAGPQDRPLAVWVRDSVNVKLLYLKRSCQGYHVGESLSWFALAGR